MLASGNSGATNAEYFSFLTGTWSVTGSLNNARTRASCIALTDGRVLLVGGFYLGVTVWPAELYDPATGNWSIAATPNGGHADVPPVRLNDGRLLFSDSFPEIFDPANSTFTRVGTSSDGHGGRGAVRLADGRVFLTGPAGQTTAIFDPTTNTFSPTANLITPRLNPTAVLLPNGRVLVTGGTALDGTHSIANTEVYDPASNTWTGSSPLLQAREFHSMAVLPDGSILVVGGSDRVGANTFQPVGGANGAEIFSANCSATTCAVQGGQCGTINDGCGGTLNCGACSGGSVCTSNNTCCIPTTCSAAGAACGSVPDGCGGAISCGSCSAGLTCNANNACVDVSGPVASLTAPTAGASVSGTIAVSATATDPSGVARVEFYDGTTLIGTTNSAPYSISWNTQGLLSGNHSLTCKAYDTLSNASTCYAVVVNVVGPCAYDAALMVPKCAAVAASCDSGELLVGRGNVGPEAHGSNTLYNSCPDGNFGAFHVAESLDRLQVTSLNGGPLTAGQTVRVDATVWARGPNVDYLDLYSASSVTGPHFTLIATIPAPTQGANVLSAMYALPNAAQQVIRGVFRYGESPSTCTAGVYDDHDDLVFAVNTVVDTTAPTVSVSAPAAGTQVSGRVIVSASATDNVDIAHVDFYASGIFIGSSWSPPYQIVWDTTTSYPGTEWLVAKAYDGAGNLGTSASLGVSVLDITPPTVSITTPNSGATVTGTIVVTASANDLGGIGRVEFYAGTSLIGSVGMSPYTVTWNTTGLAPGTYVLTAKAFDRAWNGATSSGVPVTIPSGGGGAVQTAQYDYYGFRTPRCTATGSGCDSGTLLDGRAYLGPEAHAPNTIYGWCADGTGGSYHYDESLDRLKVSTVDGSTMSGGKNVRIDATVWASYWYYADSLDLYYTSNPSNPTWTLITTLRPNNSGGQTLSTSLTLPYVSRAAIRGVFRYGGYATPCSSGSYDDNDDLVFAIQ